MEVQFWLGLNSKYGSYKGVIKSEAVYNGTCEAKPSKGKMHCPRAQRVQARHLFIGPNKLPSS